MRHRKKKITLSRTPAERKALARKMAISFKKGMLKPPPPGRNS